MTTKGLDIIYESVDYLVINNYLFQKTAQPEWDKKDNWKEEFVLD